MVLRQNPRMPEAMNEEETMNSNEFEGSNIAIQKDQMVTTWISVSNIAAAIGQSKFRSQQDIIDKYRYGRMHREFSTTVDNKIESEISPDKALKVLEETKTSIANNSEIKEDKKEVILNSLRKINPNGDSASILEGIGKSLANGITKANSDIKEEIKVVSNLKLSKTLENAVAGVVRKRCGAIREDSVRNKLEVERKTIIRKDNILLRKKLRFDLDDGKYCVLKVVGRVDGMEGDRVIEIKNRTKRLYHRVWPNEKIQCNMYMMMCDATECDLVESLDGDTVTHNLKFDNDLHTEIMEGLHAYLELFFHSNE